MDVKETGQKKQIAGYDTHEVLVTVTGHEKGKKVEDSGGMVLTSDMWVGPKIAQLDEIADFRMRYAKAIYGQAFVAEAQQMAALLATYPSFAKMAEQSQTERKKVTGTPISTIVVFEGVKSPEQMKQQQDSQQTTPTTTGGIGGMLAKKMAGGNKPVQQRTKVMTATTDMLSIETAASAEDVAIPAGFKEKK
jgi:hypothetical protein